MNRRNVLWAIVCGLFAPKVKIEAAPVVEIPKIVEAAPLDPMEFLEKLNACPDAASAKAYRDSILGKQSVQSSLDTAAWHCARDKKLQLEIDDALRELRKSDRFKAFTFEVGPNIY